MYSVKRTATKCQSPYTNSCDTSTNHVHTERLESGINVIPNLSSPNAYSPGGHIIGNAMESVH